MAKELQELSSLKPARSCRDVQLEKPDASSGTFTVDPNVGSSLDSVKAYCRFEGEQATTCVQNSTTFSQINHLHLLHTRASQTIQLPCSLKGPLRCVCVCVCVCVGRWGAFLLGVFSQYETIYKIMFCWSYSLTPFDSDNSVDVPFSKKGSLDVVVSKCNSVSF